MDLHRPPAEVSVDVDLARRLLESQHPELLAGGLTLVDEGWDNFVFRIGSEYAMRIPRREIAVSFLLNEQRWLREVAAGLPIAVPLVVAIGRPSPLFHWPWSVVEWIEGTTAEGVTLTAADAVRVGETLRALHRPAPPDAPANPFRGVPLQMRRQVVEERLERLHLEVLVPLWRRALEAPAAETAVWLHGDLHPRNVLLRAGTVVGLIDWGDVTGGDAATDLACAWTLFDASERAKLKRSYEPSDAEWTRATGWAVHFGSSMLDSGEDVHMEIGRAIIDRLSSGS